MSKITNLLFASVCATLLLTGCSGKEGDPGPTGPAGAAGPAGPAGPVASVLTGSVIGFVSPVNEAGNLLEKSGVLVTIEGLTPATTATTDVNGRYEFKNLRAGTYNFIFSRSDLSTYRRIGQGHIGGEQPTIAFVTTVTQPSSTRVLDPMVMSANSTDLYLGFNLSNQNLPTNSFYRYMIYVGTNQNVTAADGMWYANTVYGTSRSGDVGQVLTRSVLNSMGFASNTSVYAVIYGLPNLSASYIDVMTGRTVLTGLGTPSQAVRFTVP